MIEVCIEPSGIRMRGHAGCTGSDGIDRACAAVSALTCVLISGLTDLTADRIRADADSGFAVIEWENLSDGGKLLVDTWLLGMTDINREYNCITFQ